MFPSRFLTRRPECGQDVRYHASCLIHWSRLITLSPFKIGSDVSSNASSSGNGCCGTIPRFMQLQQTQASSPMACFENTSDSQGWRKHTMVAEIPSAGKWPWTNPQSRPLKTPPTTSPDSQRVRASRHVCCGSRPKTLFSGEATTSCSWEMRNEDGFKPGRNSKWESHEA